MSLSIDEWIPERAVEIAEEIDKAIARGGPGAGAPDFSVVIALALGEGRRRTAEAAVKALREEFGPCAAIELLRRRFLL